LEEALRASPELDQIEERLAAADQQIRQTEGAFYPRLVVAEDFNVTDNPVYALMNIINQRRLRTDVNFNDPGRQQNFSSRVQGDWMIFQGGSRWYDRKAAVGQKQSVNAELQAARNHLVARVTETYYRWLQSFGFVDVAERSLESARTDEKLGEARVRAEVALASEFLRLKVHTAEAQSHCVTAKTGLRRLQAALERLLARPIGNEEIPGDATTLPAATPEDLSRDADSLVKQALDKRPEMTAARSLVQASRDRVKSARGGFLPRIGANANYQWDFETLDDGSDSWLLGIQATWPLFEGGITLARMREAEARLKEMEARGQQITLDIALEVQQAALAVQEAAEKLQVAQERRSYARKSLEEVRHLYRKEVASVDTLLQADVAWNQAEVAYTAALFDVKIAQALLRESLGEFAERLE
jgi:outer membrane protein TolC